MQVDVGSVVGYVVVVGTAVPVAASVGWATVAEAVGGGARVVINAVGMAMTGVAVGERAVKLQAKSGTSHRHVSQKYRFMVNLYKLYVLPF